MVDFEERYFHKIEQELREVREQLHELDIRIEKKLDQAINNISAITKTRHDDYLAVNKRLDNLAQRLDKTAGWTMKFSIGTFIAVAGLVFTVLLNS